MMALCHDSGRSGLSGKFLKVIDRSGSPVHHFPWNDQGAGFSLGPVFANARSPFCQLVHLWMLPFQDDVENEKFYIFKFRTSCSGPVH